MNDASQWSDRVGRAYDALSYTYRADDGDAGAHYGAWVRRLVGSLELRSRVLDLGCGCGVPLARDLAAAGYVVTGVDMSAVQIERARQLVPAATFRRGDVAATSFPEDAFDAIVFLYAIIHLPLDQQPIVLARLARWLRPGGTLLLTAGLDAWTGSEAGWLGTDTTMWWSHADAATYRCWLHEAGFVIDEESIVPEGDSGHALFWTRRPTT
jgi:SAM-dependent methyltransferase